MSLFEIWKVTCRIKDCLNRSILMKIAFSTGSYGIFSDDGGRV